MIWHAMSCHDMMRPYLLCYDMLRFECYHTYTVFGSSLSWRAGLDRDVPPNIQIVCLPAPALHLWRPASGSAAVPHYRLPPCIQLKAIPSRQAEAVRCHATSLLSPVVTHLDDKPARRSVRQTRRVSRRDRRARRPDGEPCRGAVNTQTCNAIA